MKKSRLEAFSDGVLAIIITIMVLELHTPEHHAWADALSLWPVLLSYLLSFVFVGIYWNNHHHLLQAVRQVDGRVLWANLHLLFWLSLFPFVTGWVGESHFAPVPVTCYAGVALLAAVAYRILTRVIIRSDASNHLLADATGSDIKGTVSMVAYTLAVLAPLLGPAGVLVSGMMLVGVALMWLVPDRRIERALIQEAQTSPSHSE